MTSIVVGVDGWESSALTLEWAARDTDRRDAGMTAVLAWGFSDQHHVPPGEPFDPAYGSFTADRRTGA